MVDRVHAADPEVVFQGCLFEQVSTDVNKLKVLGYRVFDRCPVASGVLDRVKPPSWTARHPPTTISST
jgi:hypothetical protein